MRCHWVVLALLIGSAGWASEQKPEVRLYDVADLNYGIESYVAFDRFKDVICVFGGKRNISVVSTSVIAEMIRYRVAPDNWDPANGVSIEERGGMLAIAQTPDAHQAIAELLADFRAQCQSPVVVKGLLVASASIPRETLFSAGALAKILGPQGMSGALAAPRVVCLNTQRVDLKCSRDYTYIQNFEPAGTGLSPQSAKGIEGCVFDVQPTLSHDRKTTVVDLRFALNSRWDTSEKRRMTLASPLALPAGADKAAGAAPAFEIDLPSMKLGNIFTQVRVPAGSWILAGTLQNPNPDANEKNLLLFISAEPVDKSPAKKPRIYTFAKKDKPAEPLKKDPAPKAKDNAPMELRVFDVRTLTEAIVDFPSPLVDKSDAEPQPLPFFTDTDIASLIKEKLMEEEFLEKDASLDVSNGKLVVFQRPGVLDAVGQYLDDFSKKMRAQMTVKAQLIAAADVPGETLFDDESVAKIAAAPGNAVLASPRFVCANKQQTHSTLGRNVLYVSGMDASDGNLSPVISSVLEGCAFEARPILAGDRSSTLLNLRFVFNSDVTKTKRTVGLPNGSGAVASTSLPTRGTTQSSAKIVRAPKQAQSTEDRSATSEQASGSLLSSQYVAGYELDSLAMNASSVQTQVTVPAGKWVLAAVFSSGDSKTKTMLLFVTAETVEK